MKHLLVLPAVMLIASCSSEPSGLPQVADRYQEGIQRAWDLAEQGESVTNACARVIGTAVGMARASDDARVEAIAAYEACYVDVQAHWVSRRLQLAEAGQPPCLALMTGIMAARMSLGSFANEFGLELSALDRKLEDSVGAEVDEKCPDQANIILGRNDSN